jgi:DNA-binding SARP family transcriptional activator
MPTGGSSHFENSAHERHGEAPEVVRIRLLGDFEVSVGTRTIADSSWRLRKAASLVKLLAPGHRERAMDLLWPDLGTKAASNNLRGALHAARKTLDPAGGSLYLASEGGARSRPPKALPATRP